MPAKLPADPKDDPAFLFKTPIEDLVFFGADEKERISNALAFGRLRGIVQRFGQQITSDEFETLKACMQACVNEG
jgi:hypothetical protein